MAKRKSTRSTTSSKKSSGRSRSKRTTTRKSTSRSAAPTLPSLNLSQKALIVGVFLIFVAAVLGLSLLSPNQGQLTMFLSQISGRLFGWADFLLPLLALGIGIYLVLWGMEQPPVLPVYRLLGLGLLLVVFLAFASLITLQRNPDLFDVWQVAAAERGGGYLGSAIFYVLSLFLGGLGAILTLVVLGCVGVVLISGVSRAELGHFLTTFWRPSPEEGHYPTAASDLEPQGTTLRARPTVQPTASPSAPEPAARQLPLTTRRRRDTAPAESKTAEVLDAPKAAPQRATRPARGKAEQAPVVLGQRETAASPAGLTSATANGSNWTLPAISDILESGSDQDTNNAAIREQVEIIEHTLESFGAPATIVEINQGPTITQFGVEPNYIIMRNGKRTKVKVGKIAGLADDLALALAARSIRIQAPVPGKGYVGIEVPNSSKALVSLRDIMESPDFGRIRSSLRIGLGQNVAGQPIATDLAAMPHMLIAGTTGSGKSVCVNGIIACLLLLNSPDDLRLVMIDPKRVELTGYNGIPHLAAPVVVEMDRVIGTLQWALREMDHRYKLFAEVGARNILDFNKKMRQQKRNEKLPYIVIIVDELADLMMLAPEDTERSITRLAQMARATGIHMIIATQRPSVDVVTGLIKANFPARIAFAVASSTDSRVILDSTGAERLLGQGDMLFQSPDAAAPVRLQGCFVSDNELSKLIHYWQTARRVNVISAAEATAQRPIPTAPMTPATDKAAAPPPQTGSPMTAVPRPVTSPIIDDEPTVVAPPPVEREQPRQSRPQPPPAKPRPSPPVPEPSATTGKKIEIVQQPLWEALQEMEGSNGNSGSTEEDELLAEAIALTRKLNKASTSMLQRRFRIGYTRAARLIDTMEERGIIGPPTGTSKAREVIGGEGTPTADSETAESGKETPNEDAE